MMMMMMTVTVIVTVTVFAFASLSPSSSSSLPLVALLDLLLVALAGLALGSAIVPRCSRRVGRIAGRACSRGSRLLGGRAATRQTAQTAPTAPHQTPRDLRCDCDPLALVSATWTASCGATSRRRCLRLL
jgi:hypothetical protein